MVNRNKLHDILSDCDDDSMSCFSIDDYPRGLPAAGWRNGDDENNQGSNGNYWSSTPNDTDNAYNLNFNSGNHNTNWNNRNNGHSVRPVAELTPTNIVSRHFSITKEQLLKDLYVAYKDARRHKRGRSYQLKFEYNLEDNLVALRDELFNRTYKPLPSICFIIHDPKMREVFAANFRDRIVHHLFYNYTHKLFENTFIYDSYSCIKGRGTHFGIERLKHYIRSESKNYKQKAYILKIDIKGYFMSINRGKLKSICEDTLRKMATHRCGEKGPMWCEVVDFDFVFYLLNRIIDTDPMDNCILLGEPQEWDMLPAEKSMLCANSGCGLPIGNLSSQLFSNIYMNSFDQFVKRQLGCRCYGRYVDDAYIVSSDSSALKRCLPDIRNFLWSHLELCANENKLRIFEAKQGVEFLGAYILPYRCYVSGATHRRMVRKLSVLGSDVRHRVFAATNSYLGVYSHYNSYALRRVVFGQNKRLNGYGQFVDGWKRYRSSSLARFS